ncbi:MAG: S8 family serine peptidase [Clostridia bacterium]
MLFLGGYLKPAATGAIALSLLVGSVSGYAKESEWKREHSSMSIEAKQPSYSIPKQLKHLDYSTEVVIIKLAGPVLEEWKDSMEELGIELADYVPSFSFIAKLPNKKARQKLEALSFVDKVIPYHPAYKISDELLAEMNSNREIEVAAIGFNAKDLNRVVKKHALRTIEERKPLQNVATFATNSSELDNLLQSDEILYLLPIKPKKYFNDVAGEIISSDKLTSSGYTGKNQLVGVSDSGLDSGNLKTLHRDFTGRIKKLIGIGRTNDPSDWNGHGTHVAGSIVGTGAESNGKIRGMAPDAQLIFHSMDDENGNMQGNLYEIWSESYKLGARIQSSSWGVSGYGEYGYDSYLADQFLWEHKDMASLVAAGNEGEPGELTADGFNTIGSPATAKNVITVGASESVRNISSDDDDSTEIAGFSSKGPTEDGRVKPDIVAPGTYILSTRSIYAPDDSFWKNYDRSYAYMGGTSMATPILAGGVAQIRQFLQEKGYSNPSGALIKAMLLTGADDLGKILNEQGFGRANLLASTQTTFVDETKGLKTNESKTYQVKVTDTKQPFVLTVAWTDHPGSASSLASQQQLVNDLDVVVKTPSGKLLNGNDFAKPYDDWTDHLNNVEQIYAGSEKGTYEVTVTGYNIPFGPQPFALATNGAVNVSDEPTGQLLDEKSLKMTAKINKDKYSLTVKGKVSKSASKVSVTFNGETFTTTPRNGSFSLSKTSKIKDYYSDGLTIVAQDKKGKKQEVTASVEQDLLDDDSVEIGVEQNGDTLLYHVVGRITGSKVKQVFAYTEGKRYPLEIANGEISGIIESDHEVEIIQVVAIDSGGQFEVITFGKSKKANRFVQKKS